MGRKRQKRTRKPKYISLHQKGSLASFREEGGRVVPLFTSREKAQAFCDRASVQATFHYHPLDSFLEVTKGWAQKGYSHAVLDTVPWGGPCQVLNFVTGELTPGYSHFDLTERMRDFPVSAIKTQEIGEEGPVLLLRVHQDWIDLVAKHRNVAPCVVVDGLQVRFLLLNGHAIELASCTIDPSSWEDLGTLQSEVDFFKNACSERGVSHVGLVAEDGVLHSLVRLTSIVADGELLTESNPFGEALVSASHGDWESVIEDWPESDRSMALAVGDSHPYSVHLHEWHRTHPSGV